jgi:hypothetical protein
MAHDLNAALINLLNQEFDRIRATEGADKYLSINDMAAFLGIKPSTLSHYRTSKRLLGSKAARDFADRLRGDKYGMNAAQREDLTNLLLSTRPDQPGEKEILDWFKSRSSAGNLLLVEFRQLPAARPTGPDPSLATDVGEAIEQGLVYGLLLPFPLNFERLDSISNKQKILMRDLWSNIIDTYISIMRAAVRAAYERGTNDMDELKEVARRLKVYALDDDSWNDSCPGVGYKLFLHRFGGKSNIWQWMSQDGSHHLIHHDPGPHELDAIEARFYPLISFFDKKRRLPRALTSGTGNEMREFIENDPLPPDVYPNWIQLAPIGEDGFVKLIKGVESELTSSAQPEVR